MDYVPNRGKILGILLEEKQKTDSGLYLVRLGKKPSESRKLTVLSIGSNYIDEEGKEHVCEIQKGDVVYFKPLKYVSVQKDSKKYVLIDQLDVVAYERS